jgi:hypothetical protein
VKCMLSAVPVGVLTICVLNSPTFIRAQQPRPAPHGIAFFGRVEAVDFAKKVISVKHGKIPGYADSATAEYSTEAEADLKRLQPGDDIRAAVYPNDMTLYRIQIVYRRPGTKGRTSQ